MILQQLYLGCLSQASYLIADEATGEAAVVDPRRDIDEYLVAAEQLGVTIRHAVLTHVHADFASGHLELAERCGATIYFGEGADTDFPITTLADGATIEFGDVRLQCLATPGHTEESISLLVFDRKQSATEPHAVLTGDTMFIGDVGRPDLAAGAGGSAEAMAGNLYDSLRGKLMTLPAATIVYPGHGAGSMCGKNLSSDTWSTIGDQLAGNCALQPMPKSEFVAMVTADQPKAPAYFGHDVAFNKRQHATLSESADRASKALTVVEFQELRAGGAQVLDTRSADEYVAQHLVDSVNVGLDGKFATWCGTVLDAERPVLLIADGRHDEAILRLGRIGFDSVVGYVEGGFASLRGSELQAALLGFSRITAEQMHDHLAAHREGVLLDVRTPGEYANGAIAGNLFVPLNQLRSRIDEVPTDRHITIYCGGGYRSAIAMGLLEARGERDMVDLIGGFAAWHKHAEAETDTVAALIERLDSATDGAATGALCADVKASLVESIADGELRLPAEFLQTAEAGYARRLLHTTDKYSVVVMVWGEGQGTPIHTHDGKWCVECVYQGSIRVLSYEVEAGSTTAGSTTAGSTTAGSITEAGTAEGSETTIALRQAEVVTAGRGMAGALIPPFDHHVIENPNREVAVTIHVYGGEMSGCDTFLPLGGGRYRCERRPLEYTR